jgi:transposase-like protein
MELIAKIFGVSREAVRLWLNQAGIPTRDRIYAVKTRGARKRINVREIRKQLKKMFPEVSVLLQ